MRFGWPIGNGWSFPQDQAKVSWLLAALPGFLLVPGALDLDVFSYLLIARLFFSAIPSCCNLPRGVRD